MWWPISSGNKDRSSYCWYYFQNDYEICTTHIVGIGPRVLGRPFLLGSQYTMYRVLNWDYHGYRVAVFSARYACRLKKGLTIYFVVQWGCCDYQVDILIRCKTIKTKNELRL
jgi:hypothetical protein